MDQQRSNDAAGGQLTCSTLSLMVPTLRLMSAFAWQVVQRCNVMHYGKVEELVQLVTEVVPHLVSHREKVDLLLGLSARLTPSDPCYEADLQTLVWEFISRLDKLLPLPDIKQTAELLSAAPSLLEECGQLEFEPAQLKTLLDHHTQQGSWAQGQGTIPSTASSPQSKPQQNCSNRKRFRRSVRKLSPDRTEEDKDRQSDHGIEEEEQSDEEWLPEWLRNGCGPIKVEPDPAALMTQAEPSSHSQVATAVSKNNMAGRFEDTLCELVRNYAHLYDATSPLRNSAHVCQSSWDEIGNTLKLSAKECKNKWRVIRDRFVKAHNKVLEKQSGADSTRVLAIIQHLAWLKPHVSHRSTVTNVPNDDDRAAALLSASPSLLEECAPLEFEPAQPKKPSDHHIRQGSWVQSQGTIPSTASSPQSKPQQNCSNRKRCRRSGRNLSRHRTEEDKDGGHSNLAKQPRCLPASLHSAVVAAAMDQHLCPPPQSKPQQNCSNRKRCRRSVRKLSPHRTEEDKDRRSDHSIEEEEQSSSTQAEPDPNPAALMTQPEPSSHSQVATAGSSTQAEPDPAALMTQPEPSSHSQVATAVFKNNNARSFEDTLCKLVRNYVHLYDATSDATSPDLALHSRNDARQNSWDEISSTLKLSAKQCKNKWRSIRDRFVKAHNKVLEKQRGADLAIIQRLDWLKPYVSQRSTVTNDPNDDDMEQHLSPSSQSKPQQNYSTRKRCMRSGRKPSLHKTEGDKVTRAHVTAMERPIHRCSLCDATFSRRCDMTRHVGIHTRPFPCDLCDKRCPCKRTLAQHRRLHTGERPFTCTYCGRAFRTSGTLQGHVHTHTGGRCYKCHICGKTSIQHLARHMRMHKGEKNYLCTECGRAFFTSGELLRHTRSHTGERPYTCKLCGKGFSKSGSLTIHVRTHTREKPYGCTFCPKAFPSSGARSRHMYIHADKKPFECSKCGKGFAQGYTWRMHIKIGKCKK